MPYRWSPVRSSHTTGDPTARYRWRAWRYLAGCVGRDRRLIQVAYPLLPYKLRWARPSPATSGVPVATSQAVLGATVACYRRRDRRYLTGYVGRDRPLQQVACPSLLRRLRLGAAVACYRWRTRRLLQVACSLLPCRLRWVRPSQAALGVPVATSQAALGATVACYRWRTRRYLAGCVGRDRRLLQVVHPLPPRRLCWTRPSLATGGVPVATSQPALVQPSPATGGAIVATSQAAMSVLIACNRRHTVVTSQAALGAVVTCCRWRTRRYLAGCVGCDRRLLQVAYPSPPRSLR